MGSKSKGGAVVARKPSRIVWRDAHKVDPTNHPTASTQEAGTYVAQLGDVELRLVGTTTTNEKDVKTTRWTATARGGSVGNRAAPLYQRSLARAKAAVDRVLARVAKGADLADAWDAEEDEETTVTRTSSALAEIDMLTLGRRTARSATSFPGAAADSLRAFSREMARRGFAFGPGGSVVETWRARARGQWIDGEAVVYPENAVPLSEASCLVRVEGSKTIEVQEMAEDDWCIEIDGEAIASFPTQAEAMRYALERVGVKDPAPRTARKARRA